MQSMVSGLQHDATEIKLKLLELERAVSRRSPVPRALTPTLTPTGRAAQNKNLEQSLGHL